MHCEKCSLTPKQITPMNQFFSAIQKHTTDKKCNLIPEQMSPMNSFVLVIQKHTARKMQFVFWANDSYEQILFEQMTAMSRFFLVVQKQQCRSIPKQTTLMSRFFKCIRDRCCQMSFWCICLCVCVYVPGPQTVDLIPVCSRAGTRFTAPSMCCIKTSQSRSNKLKANLSDTCRITEQIHNFSHTQ